MFNLASKVSQEEGYASEGDLIIITAGVPVGEKGTTNLMKIQMIGSKLVQGQGVGEEAIMQKPLWQELLKKQLLKRLKELF